MLEATLEMRGKPEDKHESKECGKLEKEVGKPWAANFNHPKIVSEAPQNLGLKNRRHNNNKRGVIFIQLLVFEPLSLVFSSFFSIAHGGWKARNTYNES